MFTGKDTSVGTLITQQELKDAGLYSQGILARFDNTLSAAEFEQHLRDAREADLRAGNYCSAGVISNVSNRLGNISLASGKSAEAFQNYVMANTLLGQAYPESRLHGSFKLSLAKQYIERRDFVAAEDLLSEACAIFSFADEQQSLAETVWIVAELRLEQGCLNESVASLTEAGRLFRACGDATKAHRCDDLVGWVRLLQLVSGQ